MGTGASVPKETPTKNQTRNLSELNNVNDTAIIATKTESTSSNQQESKSTRNSKLSTSDEVINDVGQEKPISNNKLKKMALGIQGYKDKERDYDQTLAQMDFNKGQKVEWSEPKSPEKQLATKSSKDNIAWEIKQESASPSMRPYSNSRPHTVGKSDDFNRGIDFSPMSSLQPKSSASNVLSPNLPAKPTITSPPIATFSGPPPGIVVRPFPGNISGKAPVASSEYVTTTPVKANILTTGNISSPPSQHYLLTPVSGPGNIPVRPFNGMNLNQSSPAVTSNTPNNKAFSGGAPIMMAIPPSAVRGSAPVPISVGGTGSGLVPILGAPPQLIIGPNGIPVGAVPVAALPVGTIPVSVSTSINNTLPGTVMVPASPAGIINANAPLGAPRGPPMTTAPLPVVKETKDVKRNKAQLPSNLTHAKPTTGDWLNKRYIVNNYILLDILGTGSYGEVRLCKDRTSEKLYAIKIISKDFLKKRKNGKTSETYFEDIKREIAIMKKLLHPNILRLFEVLDDPKVNKMYLVLEYMKKGDLINVLKKRDGNGDGEFQPLSDGEIWQIFRQLVAGIRYLHFQNIVHGDIKPQNLLLGDDGIVKIADFGISQMLSGSDEQLHDAGGTPAFMAPELCEGKRNFSGQLADIWAMGATIYMLRFGNPPFVAKSIINLYYKICNDPLVFPPGVPIDPGLQNLIEGMLEKDPEKRLTIPNIVMHPWYRHPPAPPAVNSSNSEANRESKAAGPSASPLVGNKSLQPSSRPTTSTSSTNKSQPPPISASSNIPQSFQPPPSYDAEADEAMKGPIHRTVLHNEEVFMSIGNISNSGQEQEDYESAIGEVVEEGDDESDDDVDEDKKKDTMKASDKLLGRNRGVVASAEKQDRIEEKDEIRQMSSKDDASGVNIMATSESDIMGTNWGAGVFQMVDDDDDKIDDDDDDDEDIDDADIDDSEVQDRFETSNSNSKQRSTSTGTGHISRKESHNEMSEEEEARRSRRFIKKITKKSTDNMIRSLPAEKNSESGNIAGAGTRGNQSHDFKDTSHTKQGGSKKLNGLSSSSSAVGVGSAVTTTSLSKSQSQPIDENLVFTNSSNASIQYSNPSSSTSASAASSPFLKPGTRSVRGDPTRTFSTNSAFDDDEPEALTTEEFQAMMDTLSQHNSQTGTRCEILDEDDTKANVAAQNSSLRSGENTLGTEKNLASSRNGNSGTNSITSTVRSLRHQSSTDQALCTAAMSVVWDQLELLRAAYVNLKLKVGGSFHSEQGIRPTQEDRCILLPNVAAMQSLASYDLNPGTKEQLSMFSLAAIFDGHDGWRSSQYLSQYLATMLVTHDKFLDPKQLNNAINDTFTNIDIQLCDLLREEEDNSGSTGVVAVYDGRKKTLTVAGVGDSICVLCRNGHAIEMNKMHRITDNASERDRVINAGGKIINQRVNGVLAVSRSFGDTPFKTLHELQSNNSSNPSSSAPSSSLRPPMKSNNIKAKLPLIRLVNESLVTAVPEIYTEIITPQTEFAILASDGLWDCLTPQLAVSFVRQHLSREKDLNKVAQAIVREALDRGSIDNITVLILSFNVAIEQG